MSGAQMYVSLALMPAVTTVAVILGVWWSMVNTNARVGEFRSDLNARFGELNARLTQMIHSVMNDRMEDMRSGSNDRFGEISKRIDKTHARIDDVRDVLRTEMAKNHSELLAKFGEMDSRLTRLESK